MARLAITIVLCVSFLLLVKGIVTTFQNSPLPEMKTGETKKGKVYKGSRPIKIYPSVPAKLPDLDKGYLFNEERNLGGGGKTTGDLADISINIDDVVYEGSLIIGDVRKAIISNPSRSVKKGRTSRKPKRSGQSSGKARDHFRVTEGETISGYKVVEILPEKITFEKGSETIEKLLFDSAKQREITSRPTQPKRRTTATRKTRTPAKPVGKLNRTTQNPPKGNTRQIKKPRAATNPPPIPPEILEAMPEGSMGNPFETQR